MWLPLIQCRAMRSQARKVESVKGDTYDPPFGLSSTRKAEKRVMDKAIMATTTINAPFFITLSPPISQLHTYNTPYMGMCQYPKSKIFWIFNLALIYITLLLTYPCGLKDLRGFFIFQIFSKSLLTTSSSYCNMISSRYKKEESTRKGNYFISTFYLM